MSSRIAEYRTDMAGADKDTLRAQTHFPAGWRPRPGIEYVRVKGMQPVSGGVSMLFDDGKVMRAIFLAQGCGLHLAASALRIGERISLRHDADGVPVEIRARDGRAWQRRWLAAGG